MASHADDMTLGELWATSCSQLDTLVESLPTVEEAQQTNVVLFPNLLSEAEVEMIHSIAEKQKGECGTEVPSQGHLKQFLHKDRLFQQCMPLIYEKVLAVALEANRKEGWGVLNESRQPTVRCIEYHTYSPGASLCDREHYDMGSCVTVDIMLSQQGAFEGGHLEAPEADGTDSLCTLDAPGDAAVFLSHKYHSVTEVVTGTRNVLVVEFWAATECQRGHRCLLPDNCAEVERDVGSTYSQAVLNGMLG